jgi:hypothetical protein
LVVHWVMVFFLSYMSEHILKMIHNNQLRFVIAPQSISKPASR